MSSSSLTLAVSSSTTQAFSLVGDKADGAKWQAASLPMNTPYTVELTRKLAAAGSVGNDHVLLKISRTVLNATTGKYGTSSVTVDISLTRTIGTLTEAQNEEILGAMASLLNDSAVLTQTSAGSTVRLALVEGRNV